MMYRRRFLRRTGWIHLMMTTPCILYLKIEIEIEKKVAIFVFP